MHISFVGLVGCPNTPPMHERLGEALQRIGWEGTVVMLDAEVLSSEADIRAGYGAPTILVDGKDLFGASRPEHCVVSCRLYQPELPAVEEIVHRLREIIQRMQK